MVPALGPLVDGGWYEGWLVDCASTGTPRFVEEDDVRFLCEARGGWAIVPTQGPLGNKSSKWFRVFLLQPPSRSDPECRFTVQFQFQIHLFRFLCNYMSLLILC
jgi:hypothetical protein